MSSGAPHRGARAGAPDPPPAPGGHLALAAAPPPSLAARLRYAAAAPLVGAAPAWVDLGAGDGAAAAGIGAALAPADVLLVDRDERALAAAVAAGGARPGAGTLALDLAAPDDVRRLADAVPANAVVTCFGVLEHLTGFVALVDALGELVERRGVTAVLSVPVDAPGGTPAGPVVWGASAFEELRRLLPGDPVVAREVALAGAAVVPGEADASAAVDRVAVPAAARPAALLAAFGPLADRLGPAAGAEPVDLVAARRRERALEADVAWLTARVAELEGR